jgi:hypothetical protein
MNVNGMFDLAWIRFAVSGTLILCFGIADRFAARRRPAKSHPAKPRWVTPVTWLSIGAYYLLIRPTGGALLGGAGNLAGIALGAVSFTMRSSRDVRYPELGSRSLFYLALPIAAGVPWGLLVLTLPAIVASVLCSRRADRLLDRPATGGFEPRFRLVPGIW